MRLDLVGASWGADALISHEQSVASTRARVPDAPWPCPVPLLRDLLEFRSSHITEVDYCVSPGALRTVPGKAKSEGLHLHSVREILELTVSMES